MLSLSDKVVYCIAVDRNGYMRLPQPASYNQPQRAGDVAWNTANCRNRRIFNDRTGLASARNQRPVPAADLPPRHGRRPLRGDEGSLGAHHRGRQALGGLRLAFTF